MKKIGLMVVDNSVIKQLKELIIKNIDSEYPVSYTHLDVYKRQALA